MTARFFYNINVRDEDSQVYLLVSPGHYGRGLSCVYSNITLIKSRLEVAKLTYDPDVAQTGSGWLLLRENGEAQIEFGNTDWDKRVMRTMLDAKTSVTNRVLEERLETAGFSQGLPIGF